MKPVPEGRGKESCVSSKSRENEGGGGKKEKKFLSMSEKRQLCEKILKLRQFSQQLTEWLWKNRVEETLKRIQPIAIPRSKKKKVEEELIRRFSTSLMCPGENIGLVSAQSILERCTQVTLNAFHSAGLQAGGKHISGIQRLRELINASRNVKHKAVRLVMKPQFAECPTLIQLKNMIGPSMTFSIFRDFHMGKKDFYFRKFDGDCDKEQEEENELKEERGKEDVDEMRPKVDTGGGGRGEGHPSSHCNDEPDQRILFNHIQQNKFHRGLFRDFPIFFSELFGVGLDVGEEDRDEEEKDENFENKWDEKERTSDDNHGVGDATVAAPGCREGRENEKKNTRSEARTFRQIHENCIVFFLSLKVVFEKRCPVWFLKEKLEKSVPDIFCYYPRLSLLPDEVDFIPFIICVKEKWFQNDIFSNLSAIVNEKQDFSERQTRILLLEREIICKCDKVAICGFENVSQCLFFKEVVEGPKSNDRHPPSSGELEEETGRKNESDGKRRDENAVVHNEPPKVQTTELPQTDHRPQPQPRTEEERKDVWVVELEGGSFQELSQLPFVDPCRIETNYLWDIVQSLGIEAVVQFLLIEFSKLIPNVNMWHFILTASRMTYSGRVESFTRYTIATEKSPLFKISFEASHSMAVKSAIKGEIDEMKRVISNVMNCQIPKCGTGAFDLFLDLPKTLNVKPGENILETQKKMILKAKEEKETKTTKAFKTEERRKSSRFLSSSSSSSACVVHNGDRNSKKNEKCRKNEMGKHQVSVKNETRFDGREKKKQNQRTGRDEKIGKGEPQRSRGDFESGDLPGPSFSTSPTYSTRSPTYSARSPTYSARSPTYSARSPNFVSSSAPEATGVCCRSLREKKERDNSCGKTTKQDKLKKKKKKNQNVETLKQLKKKRKLEKLANQKIDLKRSDAKENKGKPSIVLPNSSKRKKAKFHRRSSHRLEKRRETFASHQKNPDNEIEEKNCEHEKSSSRREDMCGDRVTGKISNTSVSESVNSFFRNRKLQRNSSETKNSTPRMKSTILTSERENDVDPTPSFSGSGDGDDLSANANLPVTLRDDLSRDSPDDYDDNDDDEEEEEEDFEDDDDEDEEEEEDFENSETSSTFYSDDSSPETESYYDFENDSRASDEESVDFSSENVGKNDKEKSCPSVKQSPSPSSSFALKCNSTEKQLRQIEKDCLTKKDSSSENLTTQGIEEEKCEDDNLDDDLDDDEDNYNDPEYDVLGDENISFEDQFEPEHPEHDDGNEDDDENREEDDDEEEEIDDDDGEEMGHVENPDGEEEEEEEDMPEDEDDHFSIQ